MAKNQGTLVTAPIRPNDSEDPIASAFSNEIAGGHHHYPAIEDKANIAIIKARRRWGMLCTIKDGTYKLIKPPVEEEANPDIEDNGYWVKVFGNKMSGEEFTNFGEETNFNLYADKNEEEKHQIRKIKLTGSLSGSILPTGELEIEAPTLGMTNLGAGSQVYRNRVDDTFRFRSLVAGAGVAIDQFDNYILISSDFEAPTTGQGLSQTEAIELAQNGTTDIECTSIVAVYEKVTEIIETPTGVFEDVLIEALDANISCPWAVYTLGTISEIQRDRIRNHHASDNDFNTATSVQFFGSAGAQRWFIQYRIDFPNAVEPYKIKIKQNRIGIYNTNISFGFGNTAHNQTSNDISTLVDSNVYSYNPSANNNIQEFTITPELSAAYSYLYVRITGVQFQGEEVVEIVDFKLYEQNEIINTEEVINYQRLNEHEDYTVSRQAAGGIQTHTIKRLKEGTADHIIEYITGEETLLDIENIGGGHGLYFQKDANTFQFKTLAAGNGISIQDLGHVIEITNIGGGEEVPGEANTASNLGAGTGIWASKNGVDLRFKSLVAGSNVTLSSDANSITINVPTIGEVNTGQSLGGGTAIYKTKSSSTLQFRSLSAGTGIDISLSGDQIVITNTGGGGGEGGEVNTASNLGAGSGIYASKVLQDLRFKSLVGGSNVSLSSDANTITINVPSVGEVNTGLSQGTGVAVYKDKNFQTLRFRSIQAGDGIAVSQSGDNIVITNTAGGGGGGSGEANTASNVGAGFGVFQLKDGFDLKFRSLQAGTGVNLAYGTDNIIITASGEINTASNLGSGSGIYASKNLADLRFKSLIGGSNINLTSDANTITIAYNGGVAFPASTFGESVAHIEGSFVWLKGIAAGAATTVTNNVTNVGGVNFRTLYIASLLQNTSGSGYQIAIPSNTANTAHQIKRLIAGSNVTISESSTALTINASSTGEANTGTNVGGSAMFPFDGVEVYKDKNINTLRFRTIFGRNGVSVTQGTDHIVIEATGSGSGEANTASNLGAGAGIWASKDGVDLRFKSLVAGSNISITPDANTITITANPPAVVVPGSNRQMIYNNSGSLGAASVRYIEHANWRHSLTCEPTVVGTGFSFFDLINRASGVTYSAIRLDADQVWLGVSENDFVGFYGVSWSSRQSITGTVVENSIEHKILVALHNVGLINNQTTAT